jgi:hypothetical protein
MSKSNLFEIIVVDSSVVSEIAYYNEEKRLFLTYTSGKEYEYKDVPYHVMLGLREASSKGKFINKFILGKFFFKKV